MTSDAFYRAAERRIWWFQLAIAAAGVAVAALKWGAATAASFAVGAGISSLNFLWLKQAVDALAEPGTAGDTELFRRRRKLVVVKFVARYLLLGAAAYGILKSTTWSLRAFLAGLLLFAAGILAEICVEIAGGLKKTNDGT